MCRLAAGGTGVVVGASLTLPDGSTHPLADCTVEDGSTLTFSYVEAPMDPSAPPPPIDAPPPPAVQTHTEAPEPSPIGEVADLAKLGGDNPMLVFGLVALGILGGGTAWKFYQKKADAAHEFKMKELELKAQPTASPPPCIAKHSELDLRLSELGGKVSNLERKAGSLSVGGPSTDELDERLVKVEKALKAKKAGGAK